MADTKIAIATMVPGVEGEVAGHGARARYYLLFDEAGNLLEQVTNPFADVARGAAPLAADLLAEKGVAVLAAGDFGRCFIAELRKRGIDRVRETGSVNTVRQILASGTAIADPSAEPMAE